MSFFDTNTLTEMSAPLFCCIIAVSHVRHTLLQFINVLNLLLLHFSPNPVVNLLHGWKMFEAEGHRSCEMKASVCRFTRLVVSSARCTVALFCWTIKNSQKVSCRTGIYCSVSSMSTAVCAINIYSKIDEYQVHFPQLEHAHKHHQ